MKEVKYVTVNLKKYNRFNTKFIIKYSSPVRSTSLLLFFPHKLLSFARFKNPICRREQKFFLFMMLMRITKAIHFLLFHVLCFSVSMVSLCLAQVSLVSRVDINFYFISNENESVFTLCPYYRSHYTLFLLRIYNEWLFNGFFTVRWLWLFFWSPFYRIFSDDLSEAIRRWPFI